jgi:murein DD-endopeptidase MepM/ murein hydrolase activator NlpD
MPTYGYAQKLHLLTVILLISLAFSSLAPGGVINVQAQSPQTATPEAVNTLTPAAPPPETPAAADGSATPTGSATSLPETAPASETAPAADSPSATAAPEDARQTPTPTGTPPADTPSAPTPTPPAPPAPVQAQPGLPPADFILLSDGQFVYGPNVGSFTIAAFAARAAPQLGPYAETLYGRAEFNSINPRLYLVLMEMATGLVSNPSATSQQAENPFGLAEPGFVRQLDALSQAMFNAYYLHLYTYSALPEDQRRLPALTLAGGATFDVPGTANAGSYALLAGLASFKDAAGMADALDAGRPASFAQTYRRLFPDDDPLSQANRVGIPGQLSAQAASAAPAGLLQFPYPRGEAWTFGGVHSNDGSGGDMSSIDFSKGWPQWGADTSNIWVAAAAGGVPSKISSCSFHIDHGGGWLTAYYHLDNIQSYSGSIQQNDRIGNIANNKTQALCNGGSSTGPHVHFTLRYNGALVAINGTALSGWVIHAGTSNYDYDHSDMWLIRDGVKKYAYQDPIINDTNANAPCPAPALSSPADGYISSGQGLTFKWAAVYGCIFSGYTLRVKDTSDMDSGGNIILEKSVSGTSQNETVAAQWDDTTLYWGVQAANAANGAAWSVRHFLVPSSPNPPSLLSPAEGDTIYSRQLTFAWQSPNAPDQSGYSLRLSVSSNPDTSPWLVNTSPGNSLSSYTYTFSSDRTYYWHMRTLNTYGMPGAWVTRSFNVQGKPPGTPSLSVPVKNTLLNVYTPTLDWSDAADAVQYNLQVATNSKFLPADVRDTQVTLSTYPFITPLPANATYYWRVQAINAHGVLGAWTAYSYFRTSLNVPALAYPANHAAALTTRPTIKWGEVKDNSGYAFQLSALSTFSSKIVDTSVSGPAYTMTVDLGRGKVYYWRVRASGANQSAWSTSFSFTGANPPPIPTLLSPASNKLLANYAPSLDWSDVTPVDHYWVQVSTSSKFSDGTLKYDHSSAGSGFAIPEGLPANDTYYWRVCSYDALGQYSLWSAYRTFRTAMPPPDLVTPLDSGLALTTRPVFDWTSVKGASSYTLEVSTDRVFSKLVVNTSPENSTYPPASDLPRSQTLYWRVKANGDNPSQWSKVFSFTSANPPAIPALAAPADGSSLTNYTPRLSWNNVPKATYYEIQITTSSTFTGASPQLSNTFTFIPTDALDTNATYYWRVHACNAAKQCSLYSAVRHLHTKVPAPLLSEPAKAMSLSAPVSLKWGSVIKATGYIVQVSSSSSFSSTLVNKTVTLPNYTTISSLALTKGKTYYWRVQAVAKYSSAWSEVRSFTVQ